MRRTVAPNHIGLTIAIDADGCGVDSVEAGCHVDDATHIAVPADEYDTQRERGDRYLDLYMMAGDRYRRVTDLVFQHLANGDVLALLEDVGNIANGCDYVDDEMIALFDRARARWGSEIPTSDEGQVT